MTPSKRPRAATIETPAVNEPALKRHQIANLSSESRQWQRTKWTDEMVKLLLEHLVAARKAGEGGKTFRLTAYSGVLPKLQPLGRKQITEEHCSSKLEHLKGIWNSWRKHLNGTSGWTWNKEKGVPETDPAVMDEYFNSLEHHHCRRFRHAPPPHKEMLEAIFGAATSRHALLSRQAATNGDFNSVKTRVLTWLRSNPENSFVEYSEIPAPWSPSPEPEDPPPQSDTGSVDSEESSSEDSEDSGESGESGDSEDSGDSDFTDESLSESVAEALNESINGLLEIISSMMGQVVELFTDSQSTSSTSVHLATTAIATGFPNISSEDKLLIIGAFELSTVKADIFMALNESTREIWLNNLLRTLKVRS
jgi:Myb/SANT-like DNA-binding protein